MLFFIIGTYSYSLLLSETYKPVLLRRRRRLLAIASASSSNNGPGSIKDFLTITLFRTIRMLITEPIVTCFSLYVAVNFGIIFTFFASFPLVFSQVYGFNSGEVGLAFVLIMVGCLLATTTCLLCDKLLYRKQSSGANRLGNGLETISVHLNHEVSHNKGKVDPEHRLYSAMIGSLGFPVGLF